MVVVLRVQELGGWDAGKCHNGRLGMHGHRTVIRM